MCNSCFGKLLLSIILGTIFGILVGTGVATIVAPILFGLILVLSVLLLILFVAVLLAPTRDEERCFCSNVGCIIAGIVLAIVFSGLALVLALATPTAIVLIGVFVALSSAAFFT